MRADSRPAVPLVDGHANFLAKAHADLPSDDAIAPATLRGRGLYQGGRRRLYPRHGRHTGTLDKTSRPDYRVFLIDVDPTVQTLGNPSAARIDDDAGTWRIVVHLRHNAVCNAILPGLERSKH